MGYAKLNFATTVTTSQALYDIVRVLDGTITAPANLTYASTVNSEIVNTLAENWTVSFGSVADSTTSYIMESPCTTVGKTHYILLQATAAGIWNSSAAFNGTTSGIGMSTISAATSISSYSNPTFYSTNALATAMGNFVITIDASNTNIFLHWSSHHVLIYGKRGSGSAVGTGFLASIEYPETSLTQFTNTAPVVQFNHGYGVTDSFNTNTVPSSQTNQNFILLQGINVHTPTNNTTNGVFNLGVSGFGTVRISQYNCPFTIGTDGSNVYPLVPFYWSSPANSIPVINMSQLTGVFRMATGATFSEGVFTVGADSYVWLPISTTITGGTQQSAIGLLKK